MYSDAIHNAYISYRYRLDIVRGIKYAYYMRTYISSIPYLLLLSPRLQAEAQLVDQLCVEFEREVNQMSKDPWDLGPGISGIFHVNMGSEFIKNRVQLIQLIVEIGCDDGGLTR